MKNSSLLLTAACAASAVFFCAGWTPQAQDETRTIDTIRGDAISENPPIDIEVVGDASSYLRVHNKSEKGIFCTLEITSRSMPREMFWINAGDFKVVGMGFFSHDYKPGDEGYIEVEGYKRKLYFRLKNDEYFTDFGW